MARDEWQDLEQRLLWDVGKRMAFTAPVLVQQRTAHNFMRDLDAEKDLYFKAPALKEFLLSWDSSFSHITPSDSVPPSERPPSDISAPSVISGSDGARSPKTRSRRLLRGAKGEEEEEQEKEKTETRRNRKKEKGGKRKKKYNKKRKQQETPAVAALMERLYIDLFERGYIGISDVHAAQLWLQALIDAKYQFPEPTTKQARLV